MPPVWRPMTEADLPAVQAMADRLHPHHPEAPAVFAERLALAPAGCRVLAAGATAAGLCRHPSLDRDGAAAARCAAGRPAGAAGRLAYPRHRARPGGARRRPCRGGAAVAAGGLAAAAGDAGRHPRHRRLLDAPGLPRRAGRRCRGPGQLRRGRAVHGAPRLSPSRPALSASRAAPAARRCPAAARWPAAPCAASPPGSPWRCPSSAA